jgi:hypothetical protein
MKGEKANYQIKKLLFISGFNFFNAKFARFANYYFFALLAYLIFGNLSVRANAASGTGIATGIWKLPSQFMGLFIPYTTTFETKNSFVILFLPEREIPEHFDVV